MNILLINPYWPYPYSRREYTYNRIWPPLCLANCAALLEKEGHSVTILDAHARRIMPKSIGNLARGYDKVFVTSSSLDKWQCPNIDISFFLETIRYIRGLTNEVYAMGYHGTVEPERNLELTSAKAVIRGEPEYAVLEICQKNDLSKIKGITFKENGRIISTLQREPIDLKTLPIPAYHLIDCKRYFYEILGRNFCLFEINRGCKFKCKFCNKVMYGDGLRSKSKEQVFEELSLAIEKYNIRTGYFIDLDFLSDREIAMEVCEYLICRKYKFRWTCQTRADLLDLEILKKMKRAGCEIIHLGIETGLQQFLDYLNKNITVGKIRKIADLCRGVGIKTLAFFIVGLPGETEKDRKNMFKFIKELNFDLVYFHKLISYKGSHIYEDSLEPGESVDKFIQQAFIKYYLRPSYLFRLSPFVISKGLRLLLGRIRTLK